MVLQAAKCKLAMRHLHSFGGQMLWIRKNSWILSEPEASCACVSMDIVTALASLSFSR